ncbi:MAG: glycoside hydrolase family 38 C-terminal domain-containing protein, partial [Mycobacterium leprae]
YGVGNHGGGPTKANLASIRQMNADPNFPELELSTPNRFFESVLGQDLPIPVVHDDLQHHAPGCYAVHSAVKRWNRESENLLLKAEKFSAIAARVTGQPYPDLSQAWKGVLFNQFHDIVAGTSLEVAYDDARDLYGEANAIAARGLNQAIQSMAWRVNIPQVEGMKPIVVFNPHAWASRANVELEFGGLKETDILLDDEGRQVPLQTVRSGATVTGWRKKLSFVADLPAMGYRTYRIITQEPQQQFTAVDSSDTHLENDRLRLEVNPMTGLIKLTDKKLGFDIIPVDGARPMVIEDKSDTWSHGITRYDNVVGRFEVKTVKLIEQGPVKSVIRVTYTYGASTLYQEFAMYRDLAQVEVRVTVDWHEQHKVLKLRFPTGLHFPTATYETPYGHIERPVDGEEEPGQNWIDLTGVMRGTDKIYGLSVLNDGKYSFSVKEREMSLTVLRSPIYAHHDPYVPVEGERYSYMDQGTQHFTYVLLPHEGGWEQGGTVRAAAELNQRPIPLIETYHNGPLPQKDSFVGVDVTNVVVSVVKKAEDSDDLVIRAYETDKIATRATIRVFGRNIEAQFGPCEIKTFVVPVDAAAPVREVNLLEQ